MNKLTGDKNLNFMILMQLNDRELGMVCQVNKYVSEICKDEMFWFNRILLTFKYSPKIAKDMKTYLEFDSWKEFYLWLKEQEKTVSNFDLIAKSLEKKQVIDQVLEIFKKIEMSKWINKAEFIKVIKRHAFVNAQEDLNQEYDTYHDHTDEIDKIEWKTFKSIGDLELTKIFLDDWTTARTDK